MKFHYGLFGILSLFICLSLGVADDTGGAVKGKKLFESRCKTCHGASGEGNEAIAKMFGVQIPHLGSKEVQSLKDADLQKIFSEGKGKMQPVGLSEAEVKDVVSFLHSLKE